MSEHGQDFDGMRNFLEKYLFISDDTKLNYKCSKDAKTGLGLVRECLVQILERGIESQLHGQSSCTVSPSQAETKTRLYCFRIIPLLKIRRNLGYQDNWSQIRSTVLSVWANWKLKLGDQLSQPLFNTMLQKLAYAITILSGYGVGKFLEHGIK